MAILHPKLTTLRLEDCDDDGYVLFYRIKTPYFTSDRCSFVTVYDLIILAGGGVIALTTSKGNKEIEGKNKSLIGRDVICDTVFTYNKIEPLADGSGCQITAVLCIDLAGSLPSLVKDKIAAQNSNTTKKMVRKLKKNHFL